MGLQQDLGFRVKPANIAQRIMQKVGSSRPGSWVFQRTLFRIDRPLYRWTHGRVTMPGLLAGLPVILLTTTGARTGQPRVMPLAGIPFGDDLAVIGTNYAQERTPAWVHNLRADPKASVTWRDATTEVQARLATDHEIDAIWATATRLYSGFGSYRRRITGRTVRIFVLESAR